MCESNNHKGTRHDNFTPRIGLCTTEVSKERAIGLHNWLKVTYLAQNFPTQMQSVVYTMHIVYTLMITQRFLQNVKIFIWHLCLFYSNWVNCDLSFSLWARCAPVWGRFSWKNTVAQLRNDGSQKWLWDLDSFHVSNARSIRRAKKIGCTLMPDYFFDGLSHCFFRKFMNSYHQIKAQIVSRKIFLPPTI